MASYLFKSSGGFNYIKVTSFAGKRRSPLNVGLGIVRSIGTGKSRITPIRPTWAVHISSSNYHTISNQNRCTNIPKHWVSSQFLMHPSHRNSSYFTSLMNKCFIVKAAEPVPSDSAPVASSHFELNSVSDTISNSVETLNSESITYIPPPPALPEVGANECLNALGEPTLQSLGLGGWWSPVGILQNCLDYLHVTHDLPWFASIALVTICLRILLFPLVIASQKNATKMNNTLPQLQVLQMKMTEARNAGNQIEAARYTQEMMLFMQQKDISPFRSMLVPLGQAPIFISMFMGLRQMANLPVESFREGGMSWFVDLTLADPYYLLPAITSMTLLATIEVGADGASTRSVNMQNMKWVLRALPFVMFPFIINFPAAVLCYWMSSNFFSLIQVGILKIPKVRDYFNIPKMINHSEDTLPQKKKGMVEGFKESWSNMKVTRELQDREHYDEMRFRKAGVGPITRTFKHDPTKKKIINVQAKVKAKQ